MCGFAGYFLKKKPESFSQGLKEAGRLLHHRGPDHCGIYDSEHCGCVHNRLSIVDLSAAGNQPFDNGRYMLAYNGEIYNHLELRKHLESQDVEFRGSSDTASLFAHLCAFGVEATLKRIKGMFAFAFYDSVEQKIYLCRDRYGIKPLMWSHIPGGIAWASEAKGLKPFMALEPDPIKTFYGLSGVTERSWAQTIFKNVQQIPPGHFLEYQLGGESRLHEYYNLAQQVNQDCYRELNGLNGAEIVERFATLLKNSTERMLMSDAPMGAFVSGGIDSSLIASVASPRQADFKLFTSDVVGRFSELKGASALAAHLGRKLHASRFKPEQMISDWALATWHQESPIVAHTNAIPFAGVARIARAEGVKAILSGEGADELFLGYPRLLTKRYDSLIKLPLETLHRLYRLIPKLGEYLLPQDNMGTFSGQLVRNFEHLRWREATRPVFGFLPKAEGDEQQLTVEMFGEHLNSLLMRNDRMGMSASIEARFPFLDEDMVHFALNLPVKWKIGHTWRLHNYKHPFLEDKAIVRAAARRLLPAELVQKVKLGFPMMGHKFVRAQNGCFKDGFVSELLGMSKEAGDYMIRTQPPYFVAKLISVEVFGRLFAMGQKPEEVTEHLCESVTLQA
jgi:asparagine synthase (glutamine-hydrolysing)